MKKYLELFKSLAERGLSIAAFIFPFIEVTSYFGPKVFLSTESAALRSFYINNLTAVTSFYTENNLSMFVVIFRHLFSLFSSFSNFIFSIIRLGMFFSPKNKGQIQLF